MIYDQISRAAHYYSLGEPFAMALRLLADYRAAGFQPGRVAVDGKRLFLVQAAYLTGSDADAQMEAHREYADIMMVLEGEEKILVKSTDALEHITRPYDAKDDALLAAVDRDVTALHLSPGHFVIFLPQDAHCPGLSWEGRSAVKKVIAKVALAPEAL